MEANIIETKEFNGKQFKLVSLRNRPKWIARDGEAINPIRMNQRATIYYNEDGYPCFGGGVPVHLYVATAWVDGWFDGAEVDHIDYDRSNYNADNLRWVSHLDNVHHSSVDVNHYSGVHDADKNGRSVFTKDQVLFIRNLFDSGLSTMGVIRKMHPDFNYDERKRLWNRYNRIKTNETWSTI